MVRSIYLVSASFQAGGQEEESKGGSMSAAADDIRVLSNDNGFQVTMSMGASNDSGDHFARLRQQDGFGPREKPLTMCNA